MLSSLDKTIQFKHEGVIQRYKRDFPEDADNAETHFTDLMRFFWISKKHYLDRQENPNDATLDFTFIMDEQMKPIDQIWHVFLLYTQDYMDFCEEYFGEYLHHLPDIVPNLPSEEQNEEGFEQNLSMFLSYTYDQLGEKVVRRWFEA